MAVIVSTILGLIALSASYMVQKHSSLWKHYNLSVPHIRVKRFQSLSAAPKNTLEKVARGQAPHIGVVPRARFAILGGKLRRVRPVDHHISTTRTTFEEYCLGSEFSKLFIDCDDFAYVTFMNKRCTSVEALLLAGYLFYGKHVYQAPSVVLLLLARLFPVKFLRTFNILLLRWWVHPEYGTLTHVNARIWDTGVDRKQIHQLKALNVKQSSSAKLRPAVQGVFLTTFGRIVVAPTMLMLVFANTDYLSTGTFSLRPKDSYFAYNEMDLAMTGGCGRCHVPCLISLLQSLHTTTRHS
ncbi:Hypothetical protein PHPALM_1982 [Phytophthora palmivora]|uniref:Transmembrane protein n=1 Tax=Phytophthora palmivora TaxID=4796 RepID=A0A2P4YQW6_9STRA|nr:Hypothetical protein PHPALM_1982 [Phytophthora palmivora]